MIPFLPVLIFVLTSFLDLAHSVYAEEVTANENIPLIPRKVFFSPDQEMAVTISPDGKHITFLKSYEGVLNIWSQNVENTQAAFPITKSKDPLFHYRWAQNNEQILFFRDFKGDENSHIYSVDLKNSKVIDLTPSDSPKQSKILRR